MDPSVPNLKENEKEEITEAAKSLVSSKTKLKK